MELLYALGTPTELHGLPIFCDLDSFELREVHHV